MALKFHYYYRHEVTPEGNALLNLIYKRWAFVHEREFRLLYWNHALLNSDLNHIPAGFSIAIDLAKMIEKIVISPYAPAWFVNTIQTFVTNSGLTAPVFQSDLLEPFFFH